MENTYTKEKESQRDGRNKETTINKAYIESGEYRKKFDLITNNKDLNRLLYNCAKQMLYHRSGTLLEDMYWIDAAKGAVVAKEVNQTINSKVVYSNSTKRKINSKQNLITLHTHPNSFPPSIEDINSNHTNQYSMGIVCCHDGKVFVYQSSVFIMPTYYKKEVEEFLKQGYNEYEAQINALRKMEERFEMKVTEVRLCGSMKMTN